MTPIFKLFGRKRLHFLVKDLHHVNIPLTNKYATGLFNDIKQRKKKKKENKEKYNLTERKSKL